MKATISLIAIIYMLLMNSANGQKNIISGFYSTGDTVTLKLDNYGDSTQWQNSPDLTTWTDISGQNNDSLIVYVDSSMYFRAKVIHGTCAPYFSDTSAISVSGFPCLGSSTVADVDGNIYNTIQIGTQCWMRENIKAKHYANGNALSRYCYIGNEAYCDTFGGLYNWPTIMNGSSSGSFVPSGIQGICPTGWHLPSDPEWDILIYFLGGDSLAGGKMKETGINHWNSPNIGATNSSGFSALPGGYRYSGGGYHTMGEYAYWWSTTEYFTNATWVRSIKHDGEIVYHYYDFNDNCFAVRCLKD